MVTAATIYMSLLGYEGLRQVAQASHHNTAHLIRGLTAIDGIERLFEGPHFHEVALQLDRPVAPVLEELASKDILGGLDLSATSPELGNALLVCATETKTESDLDAFISAVEEIFSREAALVAESIPAWFNSCSISAANPDRVLAGALTARVSI